MSVYAVSVDSRLMDLFQIFFVPNLYAFIDVFALALLLLGFALTISLTSKRRPSIVVELLIFILIACHFAQILVVTFFPWNYFGWLLTFAFVPAPEIGSSVQPGAPGSWLSYLWTPFTYALLHANALHLFFNGMGLFIFGRAVAWRLGGWGFLALFFLSSAAGAFAHNIAYWQDPVPLIGSSAGIFGAMGATFRFVPGAEDRLKALYWPEAGLQQLPIVGLFDMLRAPRSQKYILICFIVFPLGLTALLLGTSGQVSVMAHLGGFAVGLFGVRYFDWHDRGARPLPHGDNSGDADPESWGMKLLRELAALMMIIGIIMGIIGYYWPVFSG